jgi:hypothetical protein
VRRISWLTGALRARILQLIGISFVCLLLTAPAVQAIPIVYAITGGYVDIDVKLGGVTIGSAPGVALLGDSVTVDDTALTIDAIRIDIASMMITLSQPFGGYDEITVESASLEGDPSFATSTSGGIPSFFTAVTGPLTVTGSWGATDSSGTNPPTSGNAITFPVLSLIAIVNTGPLLELNSVTINSIDGTPFGHPGEHLTIVGSYFVETNLLNAPEPGTGLLFAVGLVVLAAWRGPRSRTGNASRP